MRVRLKESKVFRLPVKRRPYRAHDVGRDAVRGLHVLVSPLGTRTFRVDYCLNGEAASMKLGRVEDMTLEEAREKALEAKRSAAKGINPRADSAELFADVVKAWSKSKLKGSGRVPESTARIEQFVLSSCADWHSRKMASITRGEIVQCLDRKLETTPSGANTLHSHLKPLWKYAANRELISINAAATVEKPWKVSKKETARKREWFKGKAADALIRSLWLHSEELPDADRKYVRLLIITGKRTNAVEAFDWKNVADDWMWSPPWRSKIKRNNPVPLPSLARVVLGKRGEGKVLAGMTSVRTLQNRLRRMEGVPADWIPHGMRHVVITKMQELRIPDDVAKLLTDHSDAEDHGAHSGYQHADLSELLLEAAEKWCAHIRKVIAG